MNLELRDFQARDHLEAQRRLFRECFPELANEVEATEEWYRWKFHSLQSDPSSYEFAAFESGELVGYYAALPFPYRIGSEHVLCGMVCDVMSAPKAQGKGVFTKLGRHALAELSKRNVVLTSGYPIRKAVIPGHLKVGWKIAFQLPIFLKVVRSRELLRRFRMSVLAPVLDSVLRGIYRLRHYRRHTQAVILDRDEFLARGDYPRFLERWLETTPNALVKSQEFLRWRTGAPTRKYHFVTVCVDGGLTGVSICRAVTLEGLPCIAVLDIMVLDDDAFREIDRALVDLAVAEGATAVITMMSRNTARRHRLLRNGYFPTPATFSLILRPLVQMASDDALMKEERWHLMWVDSDDL
jgi:GNAT superfamily N-acetyltransferase